jgi:hypothetical protein
MPTSAATREPYRCARGPRCSNRVRVGLSAEEHLSNALAFDQDAGCPCQCHGQSALDRVCSVEGGCRHLHTAEPSQGDPGELRWSGGPILDAAGLCTACTEQVARALADLPTDYTELHFLLASGESGITSDVVAGSRELPVPIRVSVEALQAAMVLEVQVWALPVARKLGIDWNASQGLDCRPGFLLQRCARLLAHSVSTLVRLPEMSYRAALDADWVTRDGIDGALELLRLHGLVRFAAGQTKLIHRLPSPCPRCERMTLVRHNGSDMVKCEACPTSERAWWTEDEYQRLTLILAEDYRDEVPATQRQRLASSAEGTVGTVHHEGQAA